MFLLVPAYPGCPGSKAVKRSLLLLLSIVDVEWWGAGMVICLERGADLHTAQLMPLPLTVSCFSKIQIGFTFLVPAHLGSPGQRAVKRACVCVRACVSIVDVIADFGGNGLCSIYVG